ncbi:unnamed protein product [Malus baccata var. baccata]
MGLAKPPILTGLLSPSSRVLLAPILGRPPLRSSSSPVLLAGPSRSSCSSSSGVLAGDAPVALSVGVDGHDLRVADMGDVLGEAFTFYAFKFQTLDVKFIN